MTNQDKAAQRWQKLLDQLSPATRARLAGSVTATVRDPEDLASQDLIDQLSPMTQEAIEETRPPAEGMPAGREPMYCLVECPDGEFPSVRLYESAEAMALRVKELDGEDVVVQMFYGFPVPITQGPNRVVVLPNDSFISISPVVRTLSAEAMDQEILVQDDGFLGDDSLSISSKALVDDEIQHNQTMRGDDQTPDPADDDTTDDSPEPDGPDDDLDEA